MAVFPRTRDLWRLPTLLLWIVFFLVGLAPDPVYVSLREAGSVLSHRALVNSPHLITIAFAAYVAFFCFHSCRAVGLTFREAQDRALQLGIVALVAFLRIDFETLFTAHWNPMIQDRVTLYIVGAAKLIAWWSLLSLFIRYYLFGVDRALADLPSLFPSAYRAEPGPKPELAEPESDTVHVPSPPEGDTGSAKSAEDQT